MRTHGPPYATRMLSAQATIPNSFFLPSLSLLPPSHPSSGGQASSPTIVLSMPTTLFFSGSVLVYRSPRAISLTSNVPSIWRLRLVTSALRAVYASKIVITAAHTTRPLLKHKHVTPGCEAT
ncbi:hypothetical protein BKA82DRAFT_1004268 [Pisolithus tinctorius]|nr:hypothetical protein BKA82DRAFT_1004268 [Pisolithus tinctorius]